MRRIFWFVALLLALLMLTRDQPYSRRVLQSATERASQTARKIAAWSTRDCDFSYPTVCIPSPPPDLDCGQIRYSNFRVLGSDPHGFDGDHDGRGCELGPRRQSASHGGWVQGTGRGFGR